MNLRAQAEADTKVILEDGLFGFGWPITVTDPLGTSGALTGFSNDISELIDPDTGQAVSGRLATVALSISSLTDAGLGLPVAIADAASKPWIMAFDDINGNAGVFKVQKSNPDRALGIITCILEIYQP
ncbi:MAG: hypothetical protein KAR06_04580 [Deltaproteobacteria bacterium]|nr:hypothetical protein [Deltaproteobacteria bacterium]